MQRFILLRGPFFATQSLSTAKFVRFHVPAASRVGEWRCASSYFLQRSGSSQRGQYTCNHQRYSRLVNGDSTRRINGFQNRHTPVALVVAHLMGCGPFVKDIGSVPRQHQVAFGPFDLDPGLSKGKQTLLLLTSFAISPIRDRPCLLPISPVQGAQTELYKQGSGRVLSTPSQQHTNKID